jgi:hypothetical protein
VRPTAAVNLLSPQRRAGTIGAERTLVERGRTEMSPEPLAVNEITFVVEEAPEGGYTARALGASIVTEADSLPALREQVRDAVRCHFEPEHEPKIIRLHFVREEIIAT